MGLSRYSALPQRVHPLTHTRTPRYISTIGVDYGVKPHTVGGVTLKMNFWDLSGSPEFFDVRNEFYKDAQGCVLVYDVSDQSSFDALDGWVQEAKKYGLKSAPVVVCANKVRRHWFLKCVCVGRVCLRVVCARALCNCRGLDGVGPSARPP